MRIRQLRVENFRSLLDVTMPLSSVTTLVGRNGAGKSCVLKALELFYSTGVSVTSQDYYGGNTESPVVVELTWDCLTAQETSEFGSYVRDRTLTVRKVMEWREGGKPTERYHGSGRRAAVFSQIRLQDTKTAKKDAFNALVKSGAAPGLTVPAKKAEEVDTFMLNWERDHPEDCEWLADNGQFFGFRNVGKGKLDDYTKFVYVPAVREAADDAVEGRQNPLSQLMEMVVRNQLREDKRIQEFEARVKDEYEGLFSAERLPQLPELGKQLTAMLCRYAANASVELFWEGSKGPQIPLPSAMADLVEDGFRGAVSRKGHGLQRAFILTLLQFLASLPRTNASGEALEEASEAAGIPLVPSLVLAIEEPELYQHPSRQRRIARVFRDLAAEGADGNWTQVIFSTHSPFLTDICSFSDVRLVGKRSHASLPDLPMVSTVRWTDLDVIAARIGEADGKPLGKYTGETLLPRTINVMTPQVNEGFFADVVLLVEGPSDRAALLAVASRRGIDLDEFGAIIVPVESKDNLDRPYCVFTGLGIPCYFIFDGDRSRAGDGHPGTNRRLLILGGADPVDFPETVATGAFACFAENLETEMRAELSSEVYDAALDAACKEFGYPKREDGLKNPAVVQRVLEAAQEQGRAICVLEAALDKALALSSTCSG